MNLTRVGLLVFSAAALAGPWYTVDGYSVVRNSISELGAQHTVNSAAMVTGFLALGAGLIADGLRRFHRPATPFIAFGVFMVLAGLFAHKPISPAVAFDAGMHATHSALATLAGISISAGLVWHAIRARGTWRGGVAFALAVLCVVLPLLMLAVPSYQGLTQRLMYLLIFTWLWVSFPGGVAGGPR